MRRGAFPCALRVTHSPFLCLLEHTMATFFEHLQDKLKEMRTLPQTPEIRALIEEYVALFKQYNSQPTRKKQKQEKKTRTAIIDT